VSHFYDWQNYFAACHAESKWAAKIGPAKDLNVNAAVARSQACVCWLA